MLRRALPLITGAALAAALMLTFVALWQTVQLSRLTPDGVRVQALVMVRNLRPASQKVPWPVGVVRLFVSDPALGVFTVETEEPSATLVTIRAGAQVDVAVLPGDPPVVAFWPVIAESRRRAVLIALALALGVAAVSGLTFRMMRNR